MTTDIDAIRPATDLLLANLRETLGQVQEHDHPAKGGDLFCLNLTSYMGDRMGPVLRRLADEQAETRKWRERNTVLADEFAAEADRLNAEVGELTAALAERAAQLTAANRRADGAEADLNSATKANTAWANQGRPCLIVTCADCGEKFEYDGCTLHFKDLDEARSIIEDEEWRVIDGQPMCGDCCRYKPHPFTPGAPPTELTCQRCDLEEDDHEAASTTTEAVAR